VSTGDAKFRVFFENSPMGYVERPREFEPELPMMVRAGGKAYNALSRERETTMSAKVDRRL
jgi:hypothetical protein